MTIACYYHATYSDLNLPERHRFPIKKYINLRQNVLEYYADTFTFYSPSYASATQISRCHDDHYVTNFINNTLDKKAVKRIGFPWSTELVTRTCYSIGAAIDGANHALAHGIATNISGGYHHAFPDYGSGFCIFNDLAIAAKELLETNQVDKVLIFDLDVHQGDGTAKTCAHEPNIITASIHCERNFPLQKQVSDYDIGLEEHINDNDYINCVNNTLELICRLEQPDIILYNAGADIYARDELGYLNISLDGVLQRDLAVTQYCYSNNIPLLAVSGGGYQRNLNNLVEVHLQLYKAIAAVYG